MCLLVDEEMLDGIHNFLYRFPQYICMFHLYHLVLLYFTHFLYKILLPQIMSM